MTKPVIRVPLVFGVRDQRRYSEVIEWLEGIDTGWRNEEIKEALLFYVQAKKQGMGEKISSGLISKNISIPEKANVTREPKKEISSVSENHDEDYVEIMESKNETKQDLEEDVKLKFLDD